MNNNALKYINLISKIYFTTIRYQNGLTIADRNKRIVVLKRMNALNHDGDRIDTVEIAVKYLLEFDDPMQVDETMVIYLIQSLLPKKIMSDDDRVEIIKSISDQIMRSLMKECI